MTEMKAISKNNRNNWLLDSLLALTGLVVGLTSIYFLFLPLNGYRGGRNPYFGLIILFDRHTWSDLHTWVGLGMIAIALIHFILHFDWVVNMAKKILKEALHRKAILNRHGRFNVFVDAMIALGFVVSAVTGLIYFLFAGENGVFTSGVRMVADKSMLDLVHTWGGILMLAAAVVHFAIHWQWVVKIARRIFQRNTVPVTVPAATPVTPIQYGEE